MSRDFLYCDLQNLFRMNSLIFEHDWMEMDTNPSLNPLHMLLIAAYMQEESERILTEWDGGRYKM